MKKAKSTRGVFEALVSGEFSYLFHPDFYTAVAEKDVEKVNKLYGSSLSFEDMTPEQKFDEAGVKQADLSAVSTETAQ